MTMVELLVVMTIMGLSVGISALYLTPAAAPLETGSLLLEGYLREARLKAMATTSAYRVQPVDERTLEARVASNCSSVDWEVGPVPELRLPRDVNLSDTDWSICFSSRGIASVNVVVTLAHDELGETQVEVMLGGATRVIH